MKVIVERAKNEKWVELGYLAEDEVPGSIVDSDGNMFMFGWFEGVGPYVWQVTGQAADAEIFKTIKARYEDLVCVADLSAENYSLIATLDEVTAIPVRIRAAE